jgi:hypothetical protein
VHRRRVRAVQVHGVSLGHPAISPHETP